MTACSLVALDKRPGVRTIGIGETLHCATSKIIMRAAGDQAKTACGSLQLCAGLGAGIEGETHAVAQSRQETHMPELDGGEDDVSYGVEDKRPEASGRTGREVEIEKVGGIGEVTLTPGDQSTSEAGERGDGGARDELRTEMEGMDVGGEEMDKE